MISQDLIDILACPKCKGAIKLKDDGSGLMCGQCRLLYAIREDIPIMLIEEATPLDDESIETLREPSEQELAIVAKHVVAGNHAASNYFALIKELVGRRQQEGLRWQAAIDRAYVLLRDEICTNAKDPQESVTFGTSGWRGQLGKDVCVRTVAMVTQAIIDVYRQLESDASLAALLGVKSFAEAQKRGCVVGHDNRFAGDLLADVVVETLCREGFTVYMAGESTTGVLSAAVLELRAAFSINLTPSHNPLEYGGFKYNAADAGPASAQLTAAITANARALLSGPKQPSPAQFLTKLAARTTVIPLDSLVCWKNLVEANTSRHGLSLTAAMQQLAERHDLVVVIDAVHGASRRHLRQLFPDSCQQQLVLLRDWPDVTFGGIAPEPSAANMAGVVQILSARPEPLKLGAIIDPDGDRIRFTDGIKEISMNQFGAMAYHFLHQYKGKKGMVAKTVASSNLANQLAKVFQEELFEPRVGFKEFKPIIGQALVMFEESDGISVIGHTPEKDAYIGLLLALDMVLTTGKNLGQYLADIEQEYGAFYPERDGIAVKLQGAALLQELARLDGYGPGSVVSVGGEEKTIREVITIDGRKMVFDDGSWIMIRPSGTEPKIRFYVESRTKEGTGSLVVAAKKMLTDIGLL